MLRKICNWLRCDLGGRWTMACLAGLGTAAGWAWYSNGAQLAPTRPATAKNYRPVYQGPLEAGENGVQLCQALAPGETVATPAPTAAAEAPCGVCVDGSCPPAGLGLPYQFQQYQQGEFVARSRTQYVPNYRLRPDDELEFVFRITRDIQPDPYQINVGDEVRIESFTDKDLDRSLIVQPDGTITLRLLGQVRAASLTVTQLRDELERLYKKYYKVPSITVTPTKMNTKLDDLRATVDARAGIGGQGRRGRVTPEGTIALPAIGSIPVQGMTLEEVDRELDERYREVVEGIEVTPVLVTRAPRYMFVVGEVKLPGRYTLEGPTTVMQALALAGSWNVGANINQVVVFRRGEDWRLTATVLDLRDALLGRQNCPCAEIWVADSDLIIVPKSRILLFDNFVDLVFVRGAYGMVPPAVGASFVTLSRIN